MGSLSEYPWRKLIFPPSVAIIANSFSARDGASWASSLSMLGFYVWSYTATTTVSLCVQHAQQILFWCSNPLLLALKNISAPSSTGPSLEIGTLVSWFLDVDQLRVLILNTIYCKTKFLRWGLGDAIIYGYQDKNLQDSLIAYPFSRIIVLGSLPGLMTQLVMGLGNKHEFRLMEQALNPIKKYLVTPITFFSCHYFTSGSISPGRLLL